GGHRTGRDGPALDLVDELIDRSTGDGDEDSVMASLLVITALLPLAGSLVLFASPRLDMRQARSIAMATALAALAFSLVLVVAFRPGVLEPQFAFGKAGGPYGLGWLERPDIRFALG